MDLSNPSNLVVSDPSLAAVESTASPITDSLTPDNKETCLRDRHLKTLSVEPSRYPTRRTHFSTVSAHWMPLNAVEESTLPSSFNDVSFQGVYSDLTIAEYRLRLYSLVCSSTMLAESALSLFLVLGPIQGSYLPMETHLSVKESNLLLAGASRKWASEPAYLYNQVFGSWEEKFTVEVRLPNARPLTMPSLSF